MKKTDAQINMVSLCVVCVGGVEGGVCVCVCFSMCS